MNNKIILKDGATLIGVSGIVISELDDSIFINNSYQIEEGTTGSLAFYCQDGVSALHSTGAACIWDQRSSTLIATKLATEILTTEYLETTYLATETLTTTDIKVSDRINFNNFEIKERSNDNLNSVLRNSFRNNLLIEFVDSDKKHIVLVAMDKKRTYFNCGINLKSNTIESPVGSSEDLKGDVAIDENFIYYCVKDYDGISNIWKKSELTSW